MMKKVISIVLVLLMLFSLTACKQETPGETVLKGFEKAFNERDMDALIELFPPHVQSQFEMSLGLMEGFAGLLGAGDFFSADMMSAAFGIALEANYITVELVSETYDETQTQGVVRARIICDGESEESEFEIIKISDKWYFNVEADDLGLGDMGFGF